MLVCFIECFFQDLLSDVHVTLSGTVYDIVQPKFLESYSDNNEIVSFGIV